MKMKNLLMTMTLLALLITRTVSAGEEMYSWTAKDTSLEIIYAASHAMDWSQTLHISRNPQTYFELNPIMGPHPSEDKVKAYFALTLIAHAAMAYMLPPPYRTIWQSFWIGVETLAVQHNRAMGLGLSMHF